ncbi:hypothetical protein PaG_06321 [Moesziomyces aphidis]|uniref:Protein PBN1 n=1 Tax=Moesziomyces aphidis TaxID=84754 RepID=W3VE28_MOEAP|nr:hypothetical protein PaG_06321 [Moesziomyces aphidis]
MEASLTHATSLHPTLHVSIAPSLLANVAHCRPSVLVHLPAGVFFDPFTASHTLTRKQDSHYKFVHLASSVELEHAVGRSGGGSEVETVIVEVDSWRNDGLSVDIPLHTRYQPPAKGERSGWTRLASQLLPLSSPESVKEKQDYVQVDIQQPKLVLTCKDESRYVEGFYATAMQSLLPPSHKHLAKSNNQVLTPSAANKHTLKVNLPVPDAALLTPIKAITLATVLAAALVVLAHLAFNVLPLIQHAESSL